MRCHPQPGDPLENEHNKPQTYCKIELQNLEFISIHINETSTQKNLEFPTRVGTIAYR